MANCLPANWVAPTSVQDDGLPTFDETRSETLGDAKGCAPKIAIRPSPHPTTRMPPNHHECRKRCQRVSGSSYGNPSVRSGGSAPTTVVPPPEGVLSDGQGGDQRGAGDRADRDGRNASSGQRDDDKNDKNKQDKNKQDEKKNKSDR